MFLLLKKVFSGFIISFPRIYSLVYWMRFNLSPFFLCRKWGDWLLHPEHRKSSTVLAGPGFMGYNGGICNPGVLPFPGGGVLLLAKAEVCHWWDAVGMRADQYLKGDPAMIVLDEQLNIKSSQIVAVDSSSASVPNFGYGDFRLFRCRGEVWVNHSMASIQWRNPCAQGITASTPCLSRLDVDKGMLSFRGHPQVDFEVGRFEKNWLFFEQDQDLFLLYSMNPYRLLKLKDGETLRFETVIHEDLGDELRDLGGFGTMVSFSTNPIEYDDGHLFFLIHQVERKGAERFYHHWGVLLNKETLRPSKITSQPLFVGEGARGRRPGIIFVTSVVKRESDFIFFSGEGDAYLTYSLLSRNAVDGFFKSIGRLQK